MKSLRRLAAAALCFACIQGGEAAAEVDKETAAAALARHGIDPATVNADVLRGQIAKMKRQLRIDCGPVRSRLGGLLETATTYRDLVLFQLEHHAKDQEFVANARSRFAVPPQAPGSNIPEEAAAALRNKSFYFNEVGKIAQEAIAEKVLLTSKPPNGADMALLAMAFGVRKSEFFFVTPDKAEEQGKKDVIKEFAKRMAKLAGQWGQEVAAYSRTFTPAAIERLNGKYEDAPEDFQGLRKEYDESALRMRDLALSNDFEHCIGQIRKELQRSAVGGEQFFNPGPQGSPEALPGMGFNLGFEPPLPRFEFVSIPDAFPYKLDFKQSFRDARELAIVELIGAIEARRQAQEAADFIFPARVNLAIGGGMVQIGTNLKGFATSLVDGTALDAVNRLGGKLITEPDLVQRIAGTVAEEAVRRFEEAKLAHATLLSGVDFSLSTARQEGESDQQYVDRLSRVADIEAKQEVLIDLAADTVTFIGETLAGNAIGKGLSTLRKGLGTGLDNLVSLDTGKRTRGLIDAVSDDLDNINIPDLRRRLAVDGKLDAIAETFIKKVAKERAEIKAKLDASKLKARELEAKENTFQRRFGDVSGGDPVFPPDDTFTGVIRILDPKNPNKVIENKAIGSELGSGGTSRAHIDPTAENPNTVTRLTNANKDAGAIRTDEAGRTLLEEAQRNGLLSQGRIARRDSLQTGVDQEGNTFLVETIERVEQSAAQQFKNQGGRFTKGQVAARKAFFDSLAEAKIIATDNTTRNYGFRNLGGDNWEVVVIDPGGFAPAKNAAAAKAAQKALDGLVDGDPNFDLSAIPQDMLDGIGNPKTPAEAIKAFKESSSIAKTSVIVGIANNAVDASALLKTLKGIEGRTDPNLKLPGDPGEISEATALTFQAVGPNSVSRGSVSPNPIDLEGQLKDIAKASEEAQDAALAAAEATSKLEKSIAQRLGTAAGAVAGLPGGDEQGFRLQRAASGEFRDELVSQGENRNIDAATQNKLKDLGRDLLVDFKEVRCAGVVADIVQTAKNDNDPNEGLDSLDQGTVDACASGPGGN